MGFREITDLRKSGNLEQALKLGLKEYEISPNDFYISNALAWVYRDKLKILEDVTKFNDFELVMKKVFELGPSLKDEDLLQTALKWRIISMGWKLIRENKNNNLQLRRLLELAVNIPPVRSKVNSVLIKMFVTAFEKDSTSYYKLVDWQGFNNFIQISVYDILKVSQIIIENSPRGNI